MGKDRSRYRTREGQRRAPERAKRHDQRGFLRLVGPRSALYLGLVWSVMDAGIALYLGVVWSVMDASFWCPKFEPTHVVSVSARTFHCPVLFKWALKSCFWFEVRHTVRTSCPAANNANRIVNCRNDLRALINMVISPDRTRFGDVCECCAPSRAIVLRAALVHMCYACSLQIPFRMGPTLRGRPRMMSQMVSFTTTFTSRRLDSIMLNSAAVASDVI